MKFSWMFCLLLSFTAAACAQTAKATKVKTPAKTDPVYISMSVERTAKWAGLDYRKTIDRALQSEQTAIAELLNFFAACEGMERRDHATTIVEIAQIIGDRKMGSTIFGLHSTGLNAIMKTDLQFAMMQTMVPEIKGKPIQTAFPLIWDALNEKPVQWEEISDPNARKAPVTRETMNQGTDVLRPGGGN